MSRWWRAYDGAMDDPKLQRLSGDLFKHWFNVCCIASKHDGRLPKMGDLAFGLRVNEKQAALVLASLMAAGLVDKDADGYFPHNWNARQFKSDDVTERVRKHRQKRHGNVSEPLPGTPPENRDRVSEATASGGKPPDPQDIETPKARLWREAQPAMVAMGVAPKLCGEMIGKWCSFVANDYDRVRRTILSAQKEAPLGPIAWITAILGPEKANARKGESLISIAAREQHERAVLASVRDTADHDAPRLLSAGRGG
jgi:hypothetical protein